MNLFKQAAELLKAKDAGAQLTEEELGLVNAAMMPLLIVPEFNDIPISQGLETLAILVDQAKVAATRGGAVVARQVHNLKHAGSNPAPATK